MSPASDSSEYHSFDDDDCQENEKKASNLSEMSSLNQSVFDLSLLDDEFLNGDD